MQPQVSFLPAVPPATMRIPDGKSLKTIFPLKITASATAVSKYVSMAGLKSSIVNPMKSAMSTPSMAQPAMPLTQAPSFPVPTIMAMNAHPTAVPTDGHPPYAIMVGSRLTHAIMDVIRTRANARIRSVPSMSARVSAFVYVMTASGEITSNASMDAITGFA